MAVPKRKMSRANTRTRRSAWKAKASQLTTVKGNDGRSYVAPRHLVKAVKLGLYSPADDFE